MMMSRNDSKGESLLSLVSGSEEAFQIVLRTVEEEFEKQEVETMLTQRCLQDRSLLAMAALRGNTACFRAVLDTVQTRLTRDQVKDMETSRDSKKNSLLALAAINDRVGVFEVVMDCVEQDLTPQEVDTMLTQKGFRGRSLLATAASEGNKASFGDVLAALRTRLTPDQVKDVETSKGTHNDSLLASAAENKSVGVFDAVMIAMEQDLTPQEVKTLLLHRDSLDGSLLATAARYGDKASFEAVRDTVQTKLAPDQVKETMMSKDAFNDSLLAVAANNKNEDVFKAVMAAVEQHLTPQEVIGHFTTNYWTLSEVIEKHSASICVSVLQRFHENAANQEVAKAIDYTFGGWEKRNEKVYERGDLEALMECDTILSQMLHHSARPPPEFLRELARDATDGSSCEWKRFAKLVLLAVESARNPLAPGINMSVALAVAAERAREGEERKLTDLRKRLDAYTREVFERLPQTVRGFKDGMRGCRGLLEPEGPRQNPTGRPGPLRVAFEQRQQMEDLCAVPLVMDYISTRFTSGLPDLKDTGGILRSKEGLRILTFKDDDRDGAGLCIGDLDEFGVFWWRWLQGVQMDPFDFPALTILPGAQFVIAGLLTKPRSYYRVPAVRMAMNFVVYVVMLVMYTFLVLLHEDGPVTSAEILYAGYILAGVLAEIEELRRDFHSYSQDPWNYLDVLGLAMLLAGFSARLADNESAWGRSLYALSAPLVFSRVLFFAQMLRIQGPMIQVIFSMGWVLLQFGVILFVIMLGFAASFFALFRDVDNFDETLLSLFKTILGDVELFDELHDSSRERYAAVGRVLLVVFVVVMTIMLLNLLIAILSTEHAEVHSNAEREFKVSKARTIQHYRLVVEFDILPAPFNALQLFVSLPFIAAGRQRSASCRGVKRAIGLVAFWLTLGPIAVITGTILWLVSSPKAPFARRDFLKQPREPMNRLVWRGLGLFSWCVLGAPVLLVVMWLKEPFVWVFLLSECSSQSSTQSSIVRQREDVDVQEMLKDVGASASDLRKHLENPMIDLEVQRDEVDRRATVEHLKLLRDHLEKETNDRSDRLHEVFTTLENRLESRVSALRNDIDEKLGKIVEMLEAHKEHFRRGDATSQGK